ncbi:hypothetical protein L7F22_015189 [Adiantum nelumboides]|nr:hypothetical protein [Adiantum nelumboides]
MELSLCYQPHSHNIHIRTSYRACYWAHQSLASSLNQFKNYRLQRARPICCFTSFTSLASSRRRWATSVSARLVSSNSEATTEGQNVEFGDVIPNGFVGGLVEATRRPWQENALSEHADDLGDYLKELRDFQRQLESMIEKGDRETPSALVKANHKTLIEQLNEGNKGLGQAAMLEVLIQLSLMLQDVEAVKQMLNQMKDVLVKMDVREPFLDSFLVHMGSVYLALGNKKEALACYNRSISIQESLVGENSPELVGSLLAFAGAYTEPEERDKAKAVYNQVVYILVNSKGVSCAELGTPLLHLGYIFLEEKNSEEAEHCMRRALDIAEKTSKKGGSVGVATCGLARVKYVKGDYSKAAELYQSGLDTLKKSGFWSSGDLAIESIQMEAAEFLSVVGRTQEAQDLWEEVLHEKERIVGVNSPRLVVHLQNLATSYAQIGRFDRCEPLLRRSLKLLSTSLGPMAPQVSVPLEFLATTLHHLDQNKEAESLARQALSIREKNFPDDHLLIGEACYVLASILHEKSRHDEALKLARRALLIKEKHLGKESKELGVVLDLLLEIMDVLGKTAEAAPVMDRLERLLGAASRAAP